MCKVFSIIDFTEELLNFVIIMKGLFRVVLIFALSTAAFVARKSDAQTQAANFYLAYDVSAETLYFANELIGAEAFYNFGIYGQGATVANVELGVYWPSHTVFTNTALGSVIVPEGASASSLYDFHATATASIISGNNTSSENNFEYYASFGIAPLSTLSAGAVARVINEDGTAEVSDADFRYVYKYFFETEKSDVINSSWGPLSSTANHYYANYADALSAANRLTSIVIAAGNEGEDESGNTVYNSVSSFAQSYNAITVGALGNTPAYDTISSYSSRSPSDFYNPVTGVTTANARAAVDITAPGDNIVYAGYDSANPSETGGYYYGSGTSFAAPAVSGVVSLLKSASIQLEGDSSFVAAGWSENARDSRVIKAVILNSATKPSNWNNAQASADNVVFNVEISQGVYYTQSFDNVIITKQGLDYTYGAGILNADKALTQYVGAYTSGTANDVWVLDTVGFSASNLYNLGALNADTVLTMTLVWMAQSLISESDETTITGQTFSDLTLELWMSVDGLFKPVAVSDADFNNVEHLSVTLAALAQYYIRVAFFDMAYGEQEDETYALAWSIAVPEAAGLAFAAAFAAFAFALFARRRPPSR